MWSSIKRSIWIAALAGALLSAGCNRQTAVPPDQQSTPTSSIVLTVTPAETVTPLPTATNTPTPVPLAALVNNEPITLAEFQAELSRYQASQSQTGTNLATNAQQVVLNDLVDQVLLAQTAREQGFTVDEAALQKRVDDLTAQFGGSQALTDWITAHGYSDQDFRLALRRSVEAAWMRDQIIAGVPERVEQVHARQILLYNSDQANQVYQQLQTGQDFAELAAKYDPLGGGDLGWFPRGYLTEPALEEAAFSLQPGEYSQVIQTSLGFHILQVIEKDAAHPLDPDARWALQVKALQDWLQTRRSQSQIQVMLP